jgi:hypothetical protein
LPQTAKSARGLRRDYTDLVGGGSRIQGSLNYEEASASRLTNR